MMNAHLILGTLQTQPMRCRPDTRPMRINGCVRSLPIGISVLASLCACDEPVPSASFRLIAEDVTPDRGCTSLGDKIELYFPTTTDTLRGPAPAFPGYRCSDWEYFGTWSLGCDARSETYSLSENVTIVMEDGLARGWLNLNYSSPSTCPDALNVIYFENL
jgi:hypothetical protein